MRLVIIESPYAGNVALNLAYVRAAMKDCLLRGEAPYASHALYTQLGVLDDTIPEQRTLGIEAGFAWRSVAHATVFYVDLGYSSGMNLGKTAARLQGFPIIERTLPDVLMIEALAPFWAFLPETLQARILSV